MIKEEALTELKNLCVDYGSRLEAEITRLDEAIDMAIDALKKPDHDLSQYSDKLWKSAYERGKAEAERKTGQWVFVQYDVNPCIGNWHCSECGQITIMPHHVFNYCPHCGADMRGDSNG